LKKETLTILEELRDRDECERAAESMLAAEDRG